MFYFSEEEFDEEDSNDFTDSDEYAEYYFEPSDSESDSDSWEDDMSLNNSWDEYNDRQLWQLKPSQNSPIQEHLSHGKSINAMDFLRSREVGGQSTKVRRKSCVLSFCIMSRWPVVSRKEMLYDAKLLLQRRLYRWEGCVLDFLQDHAMKTTSCANARRDALSHLAKNPTENIIPVPFTDIVNVLLKAGVNLNARSYCGKDLLLFVFERNTVREDFADFCELVLKHGYDIQFSGERLIRNLFFERLSYTPPDTKLRISRMIFDAGLELTEEQKRDLGSRLTGATLCEPIEMVHKMLSLLFKHGCCANEALKCALKQFTLRFLIYRGPGNFELFLKVVEVLVENGAQLDESPLKPCFLVKMLDLAIKELETPSMLALLKAYVAQGLDVKPTVEDSGKNILMDFCNRYKSGDLPDVVRFLVASGIDVNTATDCGENALVYLSGNEPANRKVIYETACALIELGIDVKRANVYGFNSLMKFLSLKLSSQYCHYKRLKSMNDSYYWNILNVLLDADIDASLRASYETFRIFIHELSVKVDECILCDSCMRRDFRRFSRNKALAIIEEEHFESALHFAERLVNTVTPFTRKVYGDLLYYARCKFHGRQLRSLFMILRKIKVIIPAKSRSRGQGNSSI